MNKTNKERTKSKGQYKVKTLQSVKRLKSYKSHSPIALSIYSPSRECYHYV